MADRKGLPQGPRPKQAMTRSLEDPMFRRPRRIGSTAAIFPIASSSTAQSNRGTYHVKVYETPRGSSATDARSCLSAVHRAGGQRRSKTSATSPARGKAPS